MECDNKHKPARLSLKLCSGNKMEPEPPHCARHASLAAGQQLVAREDKTPRGLDTEDPDVTHRELQCGSRWLSLN